jgi:DNA-binding HxlR family transcriptional regulator
MLLTKYKLLGKDKQGGAGVSTSSARLSGDPDHSADDPCETLGKPLAQVMTLLGKRWTGVVLTTLMQGPVYFSDLKRAIPGINDRILNERLVELAAMRLVTRTVVDGRPVRVRYEVTEHGAAMKPALAELARWAENHL